MSSPSTLQDIQFLRSQPLASLVQKEIERQILSGELAAGKRLNELTLYRRQSLAQPGAMDHSAAEHREILAAIKSGEGDAAGRVMRDHIMASSGRLQRAHEAPRTRKTK
jgi:DNA-binding GntR family transcriptional regulator